MTTKLHFIIIDLIEILSLLRSVGHSQKRYHSLSAITLLWIISLWMIPFFAFSKYIKETWAIYFTLFILASFFHWHPESENHQEHCLCNAGWSAPCNTPSYPGIQVLPDSAWSQWQTWGDHWFRWKKVACIQHLVELVHLEPGLVLENRGNELGHALQHLVEARSYAYVFFFQGPLGQFSSTSKAPPGSQTSSWKASFPWPSWAKSPYAHSSSSPFSSRKLDISLAVSGCECRSRVWWYTAMISYLSYQSLHYDIIGITSQGFYIIPNIS